MQPARPSFCATACTRLQKSIARPRVPADVTQLPGTHGPGCLLIALKRQRKQSRLMQTTLASLKQLQQIES